MIHKNPIPHETGHRFITFGEIMLRLTPPNYGKCGDDMKLYSVCRVPVSLGEKKFYFTVAEVK